MPLTESTDDGLRRAAEQDIAWMLKVKNGDSNAFRELVEHHQIRIIGTVAKMLGDPTDAEDIAQQVFIRVWKSAHRYQPTAKFTTWLYTITRNLVFNEIRRRKRHPQQSLDQTIEEYGQEIAAPNTQAPDRQALEAELQQAIRDAIASLPEGQRMAIILRRYEGLSYDEIAKVMKTSVSATKSLIFRARSELRTRLRQYLK